MAKKITINIHLVMSFGLILMVASWVRKQLLKRSRISYNVGKFHKSRRTSYLSFIIFRDRESLDILARSNLRLKKFQAASKNYRKADYLGVKLLDHEKNHFNAEIKSENFLEAFKILSQSGSMKRKSEISELSRKLKKLTDTERVRLIEEMAEFSILPDEIEKLLPWATKKIYNPSKLDDEYAILSKSELEIERYRRELARVKESGTYRLLKHLSNSIRSPTRILKLPISFPSLLLRIVSEKRGKKQNTQKHSFQISSPKKRRDCIVFFPTNGVGFGHFTRSIAIAQSFKKLSPDTEIVFFTTMPTLQVLSEYGFIGYHLPGRYRYKQMEANVWNPICEEMLSLVFSIHRPKAFVFDGAFPYRGMLNSLSNQNNDMLKIWVRRGGNKKKSKNIPVESIGKFDAVLRPGDSGKPEFEEEHNHNIPIVRTNPILIDNSDMAGINLRERMGIPDYSTLCYVQLGAGNINDIESEISMSLSALSEFEHVYTVVGESMLGERISSTYQKVRILRDYPNSKFFDQFDFAIIAGGYNSYHEVVDSELPSLCFPNLSTGRDDQLSRALVASKEGAMIVLEKRNPTNIKIAISRLTEPKVRMEMKQKLASMKKPNGSKEAALWIFNQFN